MIVGIKRKYEDVQYVRFNLEAYEFFITSNLE